MVKVISVSLIASFLFFLSQTPLSASLVTVSSSGNVVWAVLSAENEISLNIPKYSSLDVSKVAKSVRDSEANIFLSKEDNKINMVVSSSGGEQKIDVTNWKDDLIEVEERPEIQRIYIALQDGKFSLKQKEVLAVTEFPVSIDSETAELSLKTTSGDKFLSILPFDATQSVLRTKLVNRISDNKIEILEVDGKLAYKISGEKVFNFFNIYDYSIPVSSFISASTGEVLKIDSPTIFKYLTFLFV